jgi:glycosyltransferase involved in cell wall biosynthesis
VLAVPSRVEAFGTVAAEALASGTPVVATRGGGIEEYVVPGRTGELVMPGDVDALAGAIRRVLPRAASMADAAREGAARFRSEVVAADVADALREALARRRFAPRRGDPDRPGSLHGDAEPPASPRADPGPPR